MSEGRRNLHEIENSIEDLQRREQALQEALEAGNKRRAELQAERLEAFRELAEVRTRTAVADGVIDASDRLADEAASLLSARTKSVTDLTARRDEALAKRKARISEHSTLGATIETLENRLDAIAASVRENRDQDPAYATAANKADELQTTLERARKKTARAQEDRHDKGRPYEKDPLFMYLWRRRYGSREYDAKGLVRWLDGKVADLVGYHGARANYAVLLEIPQRLEEHVQRLTENATAAAAERDRIEAEKIRTAAGGDLIGDLEAARKTFGDENVELARLDGEIADISSQLNRYAEGLDHAFRKAIDITAGFLEDESLSRLRSLARSTETPSDDQIVARISKIDAEIDKLRDKAEEDREDLERVFARKSEMMRIAGEYRRKSYDDPGSIFVPDGAGGIILQELLKGAIDAAEYWARTRSRHRWRARPGDSYRRQNDRWPMGDMDFDFDFDFDDDDDDDDFRTRGRF